MMSDDGIADFISYCRDVMSRKDLRSELIAGRTLKQLKRERFIDLSEESTYWAYVDPPMSSSRMVERIEAAARKQEAMERKAA